MDKDRRIQELLEANNRLVEINRKLKAQLIMDQNQFGFYAREHRAKIGTVIPLESKELIDATKIKAVANEGFVSRIDAVLEECSPR